MPHDRHRYMIQYPLLDEPMPFAMPATLYDGAEEVYALMMRNMNGEQIRKQLGYTIGMFRRIMRDHGWEIPRGRGFRQLWRDCVFCKEAFPLRGPGDVAEYCSKVCFGKPREKFITKKCAQCGLKKDIKPCHDRNDVFTCGRPCLLKYRNENIGYKAQRAANIRAALQKKWAEQTDWANKRRLEVSVRTMKRLASWTRNNPTKAELAFHAILEDLAIPYTPQWGYMSAVYGLAKLYDVYLPEQDCLVEVHGTWHHADPRKYDNSYELYATQVANLANDIVKADIAANEIKKPLIVVWESDVHNEKQKVKDILLSLPKRKTPSSTKAAGRFPNIADND